MKERSKAIKIIEYAVPIILICAFIVSMIPILGIAKYDFATGDDYGYGWRTHEAWLQTGSLWAVIKAAFETVRVYYYAWQGTWSTIVLMALQPEVFSPGAYHIVPWIMSMIIILSTTLVIKYLNSEYAHLKTGAWLSIDILILMATIQYFPSTRSSLYWYNGGAHYIIPFGMSMVAVWAIFSFREKKKYRYYILAFIMMTLLGGGSYFVPLLVLIVLFYLWVIDIIRKQNKHMALLIIPAILEFVGLFISFKAPGTAIRAAKESGGELAFSVSSVFETVILSFKQATLGMIGYAEDYPFVFICLIGAGIVALYAFLMRGEEPDPEKKAFNFPKPALFIVLMYCLYSAMYAPAVFSRAELSGGVPNTIFQVFVLTAAISIVYAAGWLSVIIRRRAGVNNDGSAMGTKGFRRMMTAMLLVVALCGLWMLAERSTIKEATSYECAAYYISGQADDYLAQINYNYSLLLDDTTDECTLCPISDDQGPLMHMPIVDDEDNFTNTVAREFFGKEHISVDADLNIHAE